MNAKVEGEENQGTMLVSIFELKRVIEGLDF